MQGKLILVGASGAIGTATLEVARRDGLDVLPTYRTRVLPGGVCFTLETDSLDVLNIEAGDALIVFAAFSDQEWVRANPLQAYALNVTATARLAREARRKKARFIFLSSEAVFGESQDAGWTEASLPCPVTEYGRQKYEMEKILQAISGTCIVRTGWNVSLRLADRCVVRNTYEALLGKSARLAKDNVLSLTDVNDTATLLIWVAMERAAGIIHAVSGVPTTRTAMADEIIRNSAKRRNMGYVETRFADLTFNEPKTPCAWLTTTHDVFRRISAFILPPEIISRKVRMLDAELGE